MIKRREKSFSLQVFSNSLKLAIRSQGRKSGKKIKL